MGEASAASRGALIGFVVGLVSTAVCWVFPIPVAIAVWLLNIKHPFGDVMLMLMPVYMLTPAIAGGIGAGIAVLAYNARR